MAFFCHTPPKWEVLRNTAFVFAALFALTRLDREFLSGILIFLNHLEQFWKALSLPRQKKEFVGPKIDVSAHEKPVKKVLKKIQKRSDFIFIYNPSIFAEETLVSIRAKDASIVEVLNDIIEQLDGRYRYKVKGSITIRKINRNGKSNKYRNY